MVATISDFNLLLNLFRLLNNIYLNNISSNIGPIKPVDIILIYNGIVTLFGLLNINSVVLNIVDKDIPNNIKG